MRVYIRPLVSLIFLFLIWNHSPSVFCQYRFDSWTTDDGLPQSGVRQITQTPDGYIWFTTFAGLVRFDGIKFTVFNRSNTDGIINNRFSEIYCDKDGTLYANSREGGTLTVYKNGVFKSFSPEEVPGSYIDVVGPYKNGEVGFLVDEEDRAKRSWYFLRDDKFVFSETLTSDNYKFDFPGINNTNWIVTKDKVLESSSKNQIVYDEPTHTKYYPTVYPDQKGGLWLGGNRLVYLQNGKIQRFNLDRSIFPANTHFHQFWEDDDGSVLFASGGLLSKGIGLVHYKDGKFSTIGKESGLSDSSIFDVFKDREGVLWLSTNKGINRLRKEVIKAYNDQDGLNNSEVYPIFRDSKENIWIGTINGLNIYKDGKFTSVSLQSTDVNNSSKIYWSDRAHSIQSLWEDKNGKMWIGASGTLFLAENGKVQLIHNGHHVHAIREDDLGNVWAATDKGILQFQDYTLKKHYTISDGLPSEFMTTVFKDSNGRLWFGGFGGLSEYKDGKFINYTSKDGLVGNYVRSIYEDKDGVFWIGTYGEGLSRLKDGKFVNYTIANGLFSNDVFAIQEDKLENFWISSNNGIYRVNRRELNAFADKKINKINCVSYGKEDGMLNTEANGGRQPASIEDKDGNFWFPTQNGVVIIDPKNESPNILPPKVVIESATIERENVDIKNNLIIPPDKRNLEIAFTGITSIKPEQLKFSYKLEGFDQDWVDVGTRRTAYYSSLPPGNYQFRVKAVNSDGVWNEEGATLKIERQPFYYQTLWFYMLCIVLIIILFFAVWATIIYQLKARERKLARLVDEKTKELSKANDELQHLANYDVLTNIPNRRLFEEFLKNSWNRSIRSKTEISLILIDIDHFKLFNDTYGHQTGDACLSQVAVALKDISNRPTDLLARFGGEEFAIILGETTMKGAINIAEKAKENIQNLKIIHARSKTSEYITISIGVATMCALAEMSEFDLVRAADRALYKAKKTGRDRIAYYDLTYNLEDMAVLEEHVTLP